MSIESSGADKQWLDDEKMAPAEEGEYYSTKAITDYANSNELKYLKFDSRGLNRFK